MIKSGRLPVRFLCLLSLGCFLLSCRGTKQEKRSQWKRPPSSPLFRGLQSGYSPGQVQKLICRRWSFGKCHSIQFAEQRGDVRVYQFVDKQSPVQLHYRFFFHHWGLFGLEFKGKAENTRQMNAFMNRYLRKYGKRALSPYEVARYQVKRTIHINEWTFLSLKLRGLSLRGRHWDHRMAWLRRLDTIRPGYGSPSKQNRLLWRSTPKQIQREVLENFAQIMERWEERNKLDPLPFTMRTSSWTISRNHKTCKTKPSNPEEWQGMPWRRLRFFPFGPHYLQYRLELSPWSWHRVRRKGERFSTQIRRRLFSLKARGCKRLFLLNGALIKKYGKHSVHHGVIRVYQIP